MPDSDMIITEENNSATDERTEVKSFECLDVNAQPAIETTVSLIPDFTNIVKLLPTKEKEKALKACIKKIRKSFNIRISDSWKDIEIADKLLSNYDYFKNLHVDIESREFYFYSDNKYKLIDDKIISRKLTRLAVTESWRCSTSKLNSVLETLRALADIKPERKAGLVAYRNGVVDVTTKRYSLHDKNNGIQTYIDCDYNESATDCPLFERTVYTMANGIPERVLMIYFVLYLHFANRYDLKLYTEIVGESNTGKSVVMKLIEAFLGDECCKYSSLKAIETDKHATAYLTNSLSVLAPEAGKNFGTFEVTKSIVGDDKIPLNPKHGKIYYDRLRIVLGIFSNEAMVIPEETAAMYTRRVLVYFDNAIPKSKQNRNLIEELKAELPAICNKLMNLFTPEKIAECEQIALDSADKRQTLRATDHIYKFIYDCIGILDDKFSDQWTRCGGKAGWSYKNPAEKLKDARIYLYNCYLLFCENESVRPINVQNFKTRLLMHLHTKFGLDKKHKFPDVGQKVNNVSRLTGIYINKDCALLKQDDQENN
jgi:phage/plasmid-associated DNA primase